MHFPLGLVMNLKAQLETIICVAVCKEPKVGWASGGEEEEGKGGSGRGEEKQGSPAFLHHRFY